VIRASVFVAVLALGSQPVLAQTIGAVSQSTCNRWTEIFNAAAADKTLELNGTEECAVMLHLGMRNWALGFLAARGGSRGHLVRDAGQQAVQEIGGALRMRRGGENRARALFKTFGQDSM
jgi:hypothetical protein